MRKVVITGAAGFLGSHLARALLQEGCSVVGIDNLSTGTMLNLIPIAHHPAFTFLPLDVCSIQWEKYAELADINEVYHLASPASPKYYQAYPFDTISVNTVGTKNMLALAKQRQAKFLYTSTSEAYGDPEVHPQPETYKGNVNTWGPRGCYDEAKRLGEVYCYEYYSKFGVEVKVARVFNTYSSGLRNDDGRVISNFVAQALNGDNLTVYGDGSQTRSFCYVDDTINGLVRMMETQEASGEIINIGNPTEYSILAVANLVIHLTGSANGIIYLPLPIDDPKKRKPDITKAKRILNWEPTVALKEGLSRMIAHHRLEQGSTKGGLS